MKMLGRVLSALSLLLLLIAVALAAIYALSVGMRDVLRAMFDGVNPTVAAATVAAAATTIVSVLTVVVGRYFERRRVVDADIRASKVPMYMEFVEGLMSIFDIPEDGTPDASKAFVPFLRRMTPQLVTWASADVLTYWSRYRRKAGSIPEIENLFEMEQLLLKIRRDIGHSNRGITKGDLLGLFVNDIDDYVDGEPSRPG